MRSAGHETVTAADKSANVTHEGRKVSHVREVELLPATAAPGDRRDRSFMIVLLIIELATLMLHLNTLRRPHIEGDEVLLTFLAEQLRSDATAYHVQGELRGAAADRFIRETWEPLYGRQFPDVHAVSVFFAPPDHTGAHRRVYDADMYDRPLFFHPPLFPCTLALARTVLGTDAGVMLSVMFHMTTIFLVALLGRMLADERVGLIAAALMAVEAVSWLCAERVWFDGMTQMMVTAAVLGSVWSAKHGGVWRFALAGASLGLAGLTKLPAGLVAPAILAVWFLAPRRPRRIEILAYLLPPSVMVGTWLIISKVMLGSFFPVQWPTDWLIEQFPWIRHMVNRSPLVYVTALLLVSPMLVYSIVGVAQMRRSRWVWIPVAWACGFWLGMMALGLAGMGFQLRYIAPGIPALCLLAAAGLMSLSWPWRITVLPLAAYALMVGTQSALIPGSVDPIPQGLASYMSELFGMDLARIPGAFRIDRRQRIIKQETPPIDMISGAVLS